MNFLVDSISDSNNIEKVLKKGQKDSSPKPSSLYREYIEGLKSLIMKYKNKSSVASRLDLDDLKITHNLKVMKNLDSDFLKRMFYMILVNNKDKKSQIEFIKKECEDNKLFAGRYYEAPDLMNGIPVVEIDIQKALSIFTKEEIWLNGIDSKTNLFIPPKEMGYNNEKLIKHLKSQSKYYNKHKSMTTLNVVKLIEDYDQKVYEEITDHHNNRAKLAKELEENFKRAKENKKKVIAKINSSKDEEYKIKHKKILEKVSKEYLNLYISITKYIRRYNMDTALLYKEYIEKGDYIINFIYQDVVKSNERYLEANKKM